MYKGSRTAVLKIPYPPPCLRGVLCGVFCFFFSTLCHCAEAKIIFSPSSPAAGYRKKPLLFIFQPLFDLKVSFSPAPLEWLWDTQEMLLVPGTAFWIATKAYYQRQIVC